MDMHKNAICLRHVSLHVANKIAHRHLPYITFLLVSLLSVIHIFSHKCDLVKGSSSNISITFTVNKATMKCHKLLHFKHKEIPVMTKTG